MLFKTMYQVFRRLRGMKTDPKGKLLADYDWSCRSNFHVDIFPIKAANVKYPLSQEKARYMVLENEAAS